MDKLNKICGRGSVLTVSETVSAVAGFGAVEKLQAVSGSGDVEPIQGTGSINQGKRKTNAHSSKNSCHFSQSRSKHMWIASGSCAEQLNLTFDIAT